MAGYTRQSVADILNGSEITAPPINAEFNQLVAAFNGSTGHSHDGSTGNAPKIDLTTSISGYLPAAHGGIGGRNKFDATSAPATSNDNSEGYAPGSMWENVTDGRVYICVGNTSNAAVWRELVTVFSGPKIEPVAHNTIDIGTNTVRFKDLYLQGGSTIQGNSTFAGTLGVSGLSTLDSLTVTNATTLNGAVTIGNSSADLVGFNGRLTTGLVPNTDDNVDLGTSTLEWRNLYLDGTAHIDTLDVDENAGIDGNLSVGGTLGVTGTTTYSTATGSNLTATGTINFANATVSNLGTVTTAAIGGGSLNNVVIGGSTPAAITGTTITGTSLVGPLTGNVTGNVTGNLTGNVTGNVTGNLTGNVTATSGTSNFTNVTISGQLNMDATSAATITNLSAPVSDNDAARKIDVDNAVANLVDSAPGTLDTLNELAAALGDDPDFATTITNSIATKLPKAGGTMSGAINMGGQKITNAADPTAAQDLATKNYIDTTYVDYSSAGDAATDARKLATNAEDVQFTLADGSTTGYSALHYAAKAAASYDSFDDRYLGSKASDPTLDNDNNALITGALYFDSTNGVMKVYNGTEWANASSSIEGIKSNFYYTATSGQTAFSGTDDNSNTLVIDKAGLVNVYMNGVRLHEDDYTVSAAGDSVTLAAGAATGDLIYLEVFGNFAGQSGADVAITGGSITGLTELGIGVDDPDDTLHVYSASSLDHINIDGPAGINRNIQFSTDGTARWNFSTTNAAETGSNAGSDLFIGHYADNGGFLGTALLLERSSGRLGIGTLNPSEVLTVASSTRPRISITDTTNSKASMDSLIEFDGTDGRGGYIAHTSGDLKVVNDLSGQNLLFGTVGTERARIGSNGNVAIGTTNTNRKLVIKGTVGLEATNSTNQWALYNYTDNTLRFNFNGAGADEVVLDSTGNIGFGQAPSTFSGWKVLELRGDTSGAMVNFENDSSTRIAAVASASNMLRLQTFAANPITFEPNSSEAARFDTSGNLLVGKTSTSINSLGIEARNNGLFSATRAGNPAGYFTRTTDNGDMIKFYQDTSAIGSIGSSTKSGDTNLYVGCGDVGIYFHDANESVDPINPANGFDRNGAIDLGRDGVRFKDLYLSNAVRLGDAVLQEVNGTDPFLNGNAYWDGSNWTYLRDGDATNYYQADKQHIWRYAATGTAGNSITWSEAMRVASTGSLLIGRTTTQLGGGNGGNLQIGSGSGGSGMTFHSSTTGIGDIQFADGTTGADSYRGLIRYNHSSDSMQLWTGAAARMTITNTGKVQIATTTQDFSRLNFPQNEYIGFQSGNTSVGGLRFEDNEGYGSAEIRFQGVGASQKAEIVFYTGDTNGGENMSERVRITNSGLTFNGDTAAANALDDYEEGTWTPDLKLESNSSTGSTYSTRTGWYTKVGNLVTAQCIIFNTGHTGTGTAYIHGLPFTCTDESVGECQMNAHSDAISSDVCNISAIVQSGVNKMHMRGTFNSNASGPYYVPLMNFTYLRITITYHVS